MSVPKSKRDESKFEVVNNALDLYKFTLSLCLKMPKRYTFLVLQPIVELAGNVADYTKCANSVFPTNAHEAQMRIDYYIRARAELQALISRAGILFEASGALNYKDEKKTKGVTAHEIEKWSYMMYKELSLVKGAVENDRKRFKNLK